LASFNSWVRLSAKMTFSAFFILFLGMTYVVLTGKRILS
jgi:hypothetical protein